MFLPVGLALCGVKKNWFLDGFYTYKSLGDIVLDLTNVSGGAWEDLCIIGDIIGDLG